VVSFATNGIVSVSSVIYRFPNGLSKRKMPRLNGVSGVTDPSPSEVNAPGAVGLALLLSVSA